MMELQSGYQELYQRNRFVLRCCGIFGIGFLTLAMRYGYVIHENEVLREQVANSTTFLPDQGGQIIKPGVHAYTVVDNLRVEELRIPRQAPESNAHVNIVYVPEPEDIKQDNPIPEWIIRTTQLVLGIAGIVGIIYVFTRTMRERR
jgi:hypothetical protein